MDSPRTRREVLTGLTGFATVTLAGCLRDDREPLEFSFSDDFESPLEQWEFEADIGPEVNIDEFDWEISRTDEEAYSGEYSVRFFTEGRYDDGTAWMVHPIEIESGRRYNVEGRVMAWSQSESFNMLRRLSCYLGQDRPEEQVDFPQPDWNSTGKDAPKIGGFREPLHLSEGWHEYTFEWDTPRLSSDTLYLAVGTRVVWTGDSTHYLDDIDIQLNTV